MKKLITLALLTSILIACNSRKSDKDYLQRGLKATAMAQDTLSKTLMNAIKTKGITDAVSYCNLHATGLTNQQLGEDVLMIKRTALRFRNPDNAPDSMELHYLNHFANSSNDSIKQLPVLLTNNDVVHYFRPIFLLPACVACHGTQGTQIDSLTYQHIATLYPEDQAIGFSPGDLRGMWHVVLKNDR